MHKGWYAIKQKKSNQTKFRWTATFIVNKFKPKSLLLFYKDGFGIK